MVSRTISLSVCVRRLCGKKGSLNSIYYVNFFSVKDALPKNGLLKVLIRVTKSLVEAIRENSFSARKKETKIKSPERNSKRVMGIVKQKR